MDGAREAAPAVGAGEAASEPGAGGQHEHGAEHERRGEDERPEEDEHEPEGGVVRVEVARAGDDLEALPSVTSEQKQAAFTAFDELSPAFLKPVHDELNGALNYDELKILRMLYLIASQD